jgi:23S rRNA pseudouridine2605 synthase
MKSMNQQDPPVPELPILPVTQDEVSNVAPAQELSAQCAIDLIAKDVSVPDAIAPPVVRRATGAVAPASTRFDDVITGQFDADEEDTALLPPKRVLTPLPETPKLHKVLAQAGLGSRLEMEQLILQGRISVNAEPAHIGQRIQFGDSVKVNGKPVRVRIDPPPPRVIAYHKPSGEVVTHDDPQNRPTVFRRLPKLFQGKWQSVGRLDLNTEGLLLLTSSGELANKLMHPRFGLEREYAVRVLGALSNEEKKRLLEGVTLDDGVASFGSIEAGGGEGANCWYRVTISEGRNREVRRMFEAVGHAVSRLIRIRYGAMLLPRGLKRGAFVELDERDIWALTSAVSRSEARSDPRDSQPDRAAGQDEGSYRSAGGPRRNDRPGDRRGRNQASGGGQAGALPQTETGEDPHEFQPPMDRAGFSPGGNGVGSRGGNGSAGRRGGSGGSGRSRGPGGAPGARFAQPGGNVPGQQAPRRRDDRGERNDRGERGDRKVSGAGANQPDPMKTSFGYIGADTFTRQRQDQGQRRGGGGTGNPGGGQRRTGGGGGNSGGRNRSGGGRGGSGGGGNR